MQLTFKKIFPFVSFVNKENPLDKLPDFHNYDDYGYPFDGEVTPYELPPANEYSPDYESLRMRAWEHYLKTDVIQNAINKYVLWIVGKGLKLQCTPDVKGDNHAFIDEVETLFRAYVDIPESTHNNMQSLQCYSSEIVKTAILSGDCLCINRYDGELVTLESIDGKYLKTPPEYNGTNRIEDGVEIDEKGKHVAYHIEQENYTFKRIPAYGENSGKLQAWLMYGLKYKLNGIRGMSLLTAILETVSKLSRYRSATVGNAEENAKIPYTFEHDNYSTGENPQITNIQQAYGKGKGQAPETIDINGVGQKIAQTAQKQVYNLPNGAKLKTNVSTSDINFEGFFGPNLDIVYYTIGIPSEVAQDKFGGSYSGSRAVLKGWEYAMEVIRKKKVTNQLLRPFYNYWLDIMIQTNQISNTQYLTALINNNTMELALLRKARFIGAKMPHIDPKVEVQAMRLALGSQFDSVPLISGDEAAENLNYLDFQKTQLITKKELANATKETDTVI